MRPSGKELASWVGQVLMNRRTPCKNSEVAFSFYRFTVVFRKVMMASLCHSSVEWPQLCEHLFCSYSKIYTFS